jgi:serine/threonine-protein kinase
MGEMIGGRFRILRPLGRGGMGEIFLAEDIELGRNVAIKCLKSAAIPAGDAQARFRREAQAAARLDHPNICKIQEIVADGEREFIVMQYVDGITLDELLEIKSLSFETIIDIAGQITDGMIAAQAQDIVHLDIKPANIMIDKSGMVKILDFGLAEFRPRRTADRKSRRPEPGSGEKGMVMGTVSYMSPEQVEGRDPDGRSDVFSLGVVLYELIERKNPFADRENIITLFNILHKRITLRPDVPEGLRKIVHKTLRKNRDRRYHDFREIARDLAAARCSLDQSRAGMAKRPAR